mmetsp:Transcript_21557/g.45333  ORF Transcript_21557/g.45333 Transcript_21557/m.45333 type:complete len:101 (+) Transcript_21557:284-586(+)
MPTGPGHTLLSDWDIDGGNWEEVVVNLISPWPASTPHDDVEFYALMCIGTPLILLSIQESLKNLAFILFDHTWLSLYPKPMQVFHDNWGACTGFAIQHVL